MTGPGGSPQDEPDEFEQIARLYRPLTLGSPEAVGLLDDVAVLSTKAGHDLVITADTMVAGVHFLADEPLDLVARKLLRVNLSDLAAKGAEPHGYLLTVAWPPGTSFQARSEFARGLAEDQGQFAVRLLGGDTVSTAGPLTVGMTLLGWTPAGSLVPRAGARVGDAVMVSGTIGDAGLGLRVLQGGLDGLSAMDRAYLAERHRLPTPRLALREALRTYATAAADVSDGLLADAGHLAAASGLSLSVELERLPLSGPAAAWVPHQPQAAEARLALATSGDDYEIVCTVPRSRLGAFAAAAAQSGVPVTPIGEVRQGSGLRTTFEGCELSVVRRGWMHA